MRGRRDDARQDGTMAFPGDTKLCGSGAHNNPGILSNAGGNDLKGRGRGWRKSEGKKRRKKVYSGMDNVTLRVHVARMRCNLAAEANEGKHLLFRGLLPGFNSIGSRKKVK